MSWRNVSVSTEAIQNMEAADSEEHAEVSDSFKEALLVRGPATFMGARSGMGFAARGIGACS